MATFVLIPGAGAGAWLWNHIVPPLHAAGHAAVPVTLTGLGDRVHLARPEIDLETHVADVVNTIRYADLDEVVLVGQSYGGMLLPAVTEQCVDRVVRVISVDGLAPLNGEAVSDIRPEFYAWMASAGGWLSAAITHDDIGMVDPDLSAEDAAWVAAKTTPQPMATLHQPLRLERGEPAVPRTYLLCQRGWENVPYTVDVARVVDGRQGWEVVTLDAHHVVVVSQPELVIRELLARAP